MKKIEDYLHLYIGCKIICRNSGKVCKVFLHGENLQKAINLLCIPILRPLSDMTDTEETEYTSLIDKWNFGFRRNMLGAGAATRFLLSKHFDLFGLIESGLAIDATTLKQTT